MSSFPNLPGSRPRSASIPIMRNSNRGMTTSVPVSHDFAMGHTLYPPSPLALTAADESVNPLPLPIAPSSEAFPPEPPYIHPSEIGVKWPSLSYGPGIEQRTFFDPGFKPSTPAQKPADDFGEGNSILPPPSKVTHFSRLLGTPFKKASKLASQVGSAVGGLRRRSRSLGNVDAVEDNEFPFNRSPDILLPTRSEIQIPPSRMMTADAEPRRTHDFSSLQANSLALPSDDLEERSERPNEEHLWRGAQDREQYPGESSHHDRPAFFLKQDARRHVSEVSCPQLSIRSKHARFSYVGSDGSTYSHSISEGESQAPNPETSTDMVTSEGVAPRRPTNYENAQLASSRLSFVLSDQYQDVNLGPDYSQTSAFDGNVGDATLQNAAAITLEGTAWNRVNRKGRLAKVLESASLNANSRLMKAVESQDHDWETEVESTGISQSGFDVAAQAVTGSSLADTSDSGSLASIHHNVRRPRHRGHPGHSRPVHPVHPAHPRYAHNLNLLQDKQNGKMVLTPEYKFADGSGFPNRNALTVPNPTQALTSRYQHHQAPLSTHRGNPFLSSFPNPLASAPVDPFTSSQPSPFTNLPEDPFTSSSTNPFTSTSANPFTSSSADPFRSSRPIPFVNLPEDPFTSSSTNPFSANSLTYTSANPYASSPVNPFTSAPANPFTSSLPPIDSLQASRLITANQTPTKSSRFWPRTLRFKLSKESKTVNTILPTNTAYQSRIDMAAPNNSIVKDESHDEAFTTAVDAGMQDHSYPSSAWLSTTDGVTTSQHVDLRHGRTGSFSKTTTLSPMSNVTGTPIGIGAQEAGSSLAGGSSPPAVKSIERVSKPTISPVTPRQKRHIAGPRSGASSSANTYHRRTIDGSFEMTEFHNDKSSSRYGMRGFDVDTEVGPSKERTDQLSPEVQKHRQHLVQHSLLAGPSVTKSKRFSMPQELLGTASSSYPLKDKDSASTAVIKTGAEVDLAPYAPWNTTDRIIRNNSPRRRRKIDEAPISEQQSEYSNSMIGRSSWASFEPLASDHTQLHQTQSGPFARPYETLYDGLDAVRGRSFPPRPILRPQPPQPSISPRPIARAESPHLLRVPRQSAEAMIKRHKELSRVFLVVCCLAAPIAAVYGHGGFDEVMRHLTRGEMDGFRREEKVLGRWIGWGAIAGIVGALIWAFIHR